MGFVPIRRGFVRRVREPIAELLRVEERLIHGQIVEVKIYGPGSSGRVAYKSGVDIAAADLAAREEAKKNYQPELELAYMGLPSHPHPDHSDKRGERDTKSRAGR